VREGARLAVKAPAGSFHLTDEDAVPVVLIAGSIGLTPLLSMLNSLLHVGSRREIWLFYGGRNAIAPSRTCASIWMRWAGAIRTSD
jgi:ferredoxin-NADP reductase